MRSPYDLRGLERELAHLRPRTPTMPVFSAVAGRDIAPDGTFDALHWHWMMGHPYWYAEATSAALRDGPAVIVNIGAEPVTTPWIRQTTTHLGIDPLIVDSMRRGNETEAWNRARRTLARRLTRVAPIARPAADPPRLDPAALDLAAAEVARDPFRYLDALRRQGPVHYLAHHNMWLVVRDREVREAFARPDVFSSRPMASLDPLVIGADPPAHAAARRALSPRFSSAALAELGAFATDAAHASLEALSGAAELDVLRDFAAPLGERVAGRLFGLDDGQVARVRATVGDPERGTVDLLALVDAALGEVLPEGNSLDRLLWIAATTTTKRLISAAVLLLLDDPDLRSPVTGDPSLLPALLDEAGRLHPPEFMVPRLATVEVTLGGVRIPRGAVVQLSIAAANRDAARFENPNQVDLERSTAHFAFGAGPHHCAGRRLARIEAEVALRALLERMPDFVGVQPPCALRWIPSAGTHGLEQLMIAPGHRPAP